MRLRLNSRWELWLDDPLGNRLSLLNKSVVEFWLSRVLNDIGEFQTVLRGNFDQSLLLEDGLIEFWRAPAGGALRWVGVGKVRKILFSDNENGKEIITVSGPDGIDLLQTRIVAYAAGSAQAEKTGPADDLLKAIVRENMGSMATDSVRNLTELGLSVAADLGLAPSVTKAFAHKPVLSVLQEISAASREKGTGLYFDVVPSDLPNGAVTFEFRTYTGQRGVDRSSNSNNPIYFGKKWKNLTNPVLEYDYLNEWNYVYAGGQGEGAGRKIIEVLDAGRIGNSPWNRREKFVDARNEMTDPGVTARGQSELSAGRPRVRFSGDLLDSRTARYGIDWEFGDRASIEYQGRQIDGMIRTVRLGKAKDGVEIIEARIEVIE